MMNRMVWAPAALSLVLLSGCSTPAQPQVKQLHREVSQLNQQMQQLTSQASAVEIQGQLNAHSQQGAWLLPQANTPVALQTQAGTLRLSLARIEAEAGGTHADLTLRTQDNSPLPGMHATVIWGQLDPATGKPIEADSLTQTLSVPASLTPRSSVTVPLRLKDVTPEQLGYVRIHHVIADTSRP